MGVEDTNIGKVAIDFIVVKAIADHEVVGDGKAYPVHRHDDFTAFGLIEQGNDTEGSGLAFLQNPHQIIECIAAVDNVFDNQDVASFNRLVEVLENAYNPAAFGSGAIAAGCHEVDLMRDIDGA